MSLSFHPVRGVLLVATKSIVCPSHPVGVYCDGIRKVLFSFLLKSAKKLIGEQKVCVLQAKRASILLSSDKARLLTTDYY